MDSFHLHNLITGNAWYNLGNQVLLISRRNDPQRTYGDEITPSGENSPWYFFRKQIQQLTYILNYSFSAKAGMADAWITLGLVQPQVFSF